MFYTRCVLLPGHTYAHTLTYQVCLLLDHTRAHTLTYSLQQHCLSFFDDYTTTTTLAYKVCFTPWSYTLTIHSCLHQRCMFYTGCVLLPGHTPAHTLAYQVCFTPWSYTCAYIDIQLAATLSEFLRRLHNNNNNNNAWSVRLRDVDLAALLGCSGVVSFIPGVFYSLVAQVRTHWQYIRGCISVVCFIPGVFTPWS